MGLLAVQAYNYNKNNNGKPDDPLIYDALSKGYSALDGNKHSILTGSSNECKALAEIDNKLFSVDLDGKIRMWTNDGISKITDVLSYPNPMNFVSFNASNNQIITGYDNLTLCLWNMETAEKVNHTYLELKGHNGPVRTVGFSSDNNFMATAGRDRLIKIWNIQTKNPSAVNTLKTEKYIKAVLFCGTDTLIYAQDNGDIIIWDIKKMKFSILYSSDVEMALCLAWNAQKRTLLAGCSNGMLLVFHLNQKILTWPDKYEVHTSGIDQIVFNSDFSFFATASWDKKVRFYNYHSFCVLSEGRAITLGNVESRVRALIFSGDNRLVASLSDKSIHVWETSSQNLAAMICSIVKRDMTRFEWNWMIGDDIPYETTCTKTP
jgi:WD40 repeat protein